MFVDLFVLNRRAHTPSMREALSWVAACIGSAAAFNVLLFYRFGAQVALEFTTGYVVEEALSVDNLFVFLVLFRSLGVPQQYQHRVLFWGILGAVVMRGVFVFLGAALIERFHWILYAFGAFLVLTGVKLLAAKDVEPHPERNLLVRVFTRFVPTTAGYREGHFVVRENGRRLATPLLVALVAAEATDVVFATDSIPAIFAITRDPFIVFTSNIFAILGLRALYFVLAGLLDRFHYLKLGLAAVLIFVGVKMLIEPWLHVPIAVSLGVIVGVLA
ncbi:MAG TPA: TerC family protein, partial [Planctomycetota bacterium]|nr:TerC family protein [Planctomycetota bacterium]